MITCPDCSSPEWPIRLPNGVYNGGSRVCSQCHASVIVHKGNARIRTQAKCEINAVRRATRSDYLHAVVNAVDMRILCAKCHTETDLVSGTDGKLGSLHGVFCALCSATYNVHPLDEKRTKHGIKVRPLTWNNPIQRREAEAGIMAIAGALESGNDPLAYGVLLQGANWSGMRVRQLPDKINQLGEPNADYRNAANRPGRIDTSHGSYFVCAGTERGGKVDNRVPGMHPDYCPCTDCLRKA